MYYWRASLKSKVKFIDVIAGDGDTACEMVGDQMEEGVEIDDIECIGQVEREDYVGEPDGVAERGAKC